MCAIIYIIDITIDTVNANFEKYRYELLNDGDTFCEMRRYAISSLCERHRLYLNKTR